MGASHLLRMLEPAVRPIAGASATTPTAPGKPPIEQQSFEALLEAAKQADATDNTESTDAAKPTAPSPLASLAQVDRIENASLRDLLQGRA